MTRLTPFNLRTSRLASFLPISRNMAGNQAGTSRPSTASTTSTVAARVKAVLSGKATRSAKEAEVRAAEQSAHKLELKAAVGAERARCAGIVEAAVDMNCAALAASVISDGSVTPEAAKRVFASTRTAMSMRRRVGLDEVMAAVRIPNPGSVIAGSEQDGGVNNVVAKAKALYNAAIGR